MLGIGSLVRNWAAFGPNCRGVGEVGAVWASAKYETNGRLNEDYTLADHAAHRDVVYGGVSP